MNLSSGSKMICMLFNCRLHKSKSAICWISIELCCHDDTL